MARATTANSSSCRSIRQTASDIEHHQPAYFTTRREPRLIPPDQKRRGPRSSYIGSEVFLSLVDSSRRRMPRDLRQLSMQALCTNRDLVAADADRLGAERFLPEHRRAGDERARRSAARAGPYSRARRRRDRLARDQPPVAELSVARQCDAGSRARRRCATCSSSTPRRPMSSATTQIEGHSVGRRAAGRAAAADAGADRVRPRARDHRGRRRDGLRRRQRVSARRRAGTLLRALRVDQLCHRNGAAVAESRRDQSMDAKLGHETDALTFLADVGEGAVSLRLLPDAATARVPVRSTSRAGARRCVRLTSRSGSARTPICRSRRRRWPSLEFGKDGAPAAPAGEAVRPARPERSAADSHHGVRARSAPARRRSDAQPVSRSASPSVHRAVLPRLGAGAAARQSRSAGRRSLPDVRRRVRRHRTAAAAPSRHGAGSGEAVSRRHACAPGAQCRRPGGDHSPVLSRAGPHRGVRWPLADHCAARPHVPAGATARSSARVRCWARGSGIVRASSASTSAR